MSVLIRLYDVLKGDYTGLPYIGFLCCKNLVGVLVRYETRELTCDDLYYQVKRRITN